MQINCYQGEKGNYSHCSHGCNYFGNGWLYSLVPQNVELFDGKSFEGKGLAPDLYIKNTMSEINSGIDRTMEVAIDELNQ